MKIFWGLVGVAAFVGACERMEPTPNPAETVHYIVTDRPEFSPAACKLTVRRQDDPNGIGKLSILFINGAPDTPERRKYEECRRLRIGGFHTRIVRD